MAWHYIVNLWVDPRCTAVLSVTAREADGCLGRKPSDTSTLAALQSGFRAATRETGFIGKGKCELLKAVVLRCLAELHFSSS